MNALFGRSIITGLVCLAISVGWQMLAYQVFSGYGLSAGFAKIVAEEPSLFDFIARGLFSPLAETLIFLVVYLILWSSIPNSVNYKKSLVNSLFFLFAVTFGFFAHGANFVSLSRVFCFILLGGLFLNQTSAYKTSRAFWAMFSAHITWNLCGLGLMLSL